MSAFLVTVMVIIWLLLSGIINTSQLALLFTPFLAASFIFGDSCKKMFDGLIFAFAMHPFDVGDRVVINNVQMKVTKLHILTSTFYKYDTAEEVITPNSILTTTSIINLDIAPDEGDKIEFVLSTQTPLEDVKDLEIKIKKYLDDDIEYSSNNTVVKSEIDKEDMKMIVYFKYLVSYLTTEAKAMHRSKILSKIMELINEMDQGKSKKGSSSYDLYNVDISLASMAKLKDIQDLEDEILRRLEEKYSTCSKVVITELARKKVKIGLYIYGSDDPKVNGKKKYEKKEDNENEFHHVWKKSVNTGRLKKNMLEDISEGLKRKKLVENVQIYQMVKTGKVDVIAQGGIGLSSFQASDVIQSQDDIGQSSTPLETIGSGSKHANLIVMQEVEEAVLEHAQSEENIHPMTFEDNN